jgi:hypothetical protein
MFPVKIVHNKVVLKKYVTEEKYLINWKGNTHNSQP